MPSAKILEQKQALVAALAEQMKNAGSGVIVDYQGITVGDDTALRAELRKNNVHYAVVKNTLASKACDLIGFEELKGVLTGMTALAIGDDEVAPAKVLAAFAEKHDNFKIKAGFVDGKVIGENAVNDLAKLPSKEQLIAKMLGSLNAPATGLVTVLNGSMKGLVVALKAIADKQGA
ncbi:MAG TPA: 50S ribosomal protein L10 [Bacillota bacterium]|nr:50S ribosomal protein L10 [Bacillota bacterium]